VQAQSPDGMKKSRSATARNERCIMNMYRTL
jgi:hypothetical protein